MAYTKLQIYQMAADALDDDVITSLSDDTKVVRWLNRNYTLVKETTLSIHRWKFAKRRQNLAEIPGDTGTDWDYKYLVPSEALLLYRLTNDGKIGGYAIPYEFEGGYIYTDQPPSLPIRYIANVNEDQFTALFTAVLVTTCALKMAHFVTHKTNMVAIAKEDRKEALRAAMLYDAIENYAEPPVPYEIETVRFSSGC
jgi:hypothetical protein